MRTHREKPVAIARSPLLAAVVAALLLSAVQGCSVRRLAVNSLADALAGSGDVFAADEDPELVGEALPFALKTFEALVQQSPENVGLLVSTCQGFTLYGFAFVELEAQRLEPTDYRAAEHLRDRALKLYLRARGYCLRALDVVSPGFSAAVYRDPAGAAAEIGADHVAGVYWTAVSWGAAISLGLDRPELVIDLPAVRALLERGLAVDEDYEDGVLHDAMIAVEGLPENMGGSVERAQRHYERSLELSAGNRVSTYVAWALSVALRQQDRAEFVRQLELALAVDLDARPKDRLANTIQQRRAARLLSRVDELFLDDALEEEPADGESTPGGEGT